MKQTKEIEIIEQSPDMKAKLAELAQLVDSKAAHKQPSELLKNWEEKLDDLLIGIDKETTETSEGWWENSSGKNFGAQTLGKLKRLIISIMEEKDAETAELVEAERKKLNEHNVVDFMRKEYGMEDDAYTTSDVQEILEAFCEYIKKLNHE